jgi:tRNA G18 (ribose-2'-O)-methylase SpoU
MSLNNSYALFKEKRENSGEAHVAQPIIVADRILSPMNVGAILRLAGNINAKKVWFVYDEDPGFRAYKIKRTSSGASEKVDWEMISTDKLTDVLPQGYEMIAIETTEDAQNIYTAQLPEKVVLMVGNERFGLQDKLVEICQRKLFIPIPGPISSLNVSQALAVGLFEWLRQRQDKA